MKIDTTVKFIRDIPEHNIKKDDEVEVTVDEDYVSDNAEEVVEWVINELSEKYNKTFVYSHSDEGVGDFVILNLEDVINAISREEFLNKTEV